VAPAQQVAIEAEQLGEYQAKAVVHRNRTAAKTNAVLEPNSRST
jgi:hypothetical protein